MKVLQVITKEEQKHFVDSLYVDATSLENIASLEQGTTKWLESRIGRLTGSIMGAVVGHNPFCTHKKLLAQLLWDSFQGNEATAYGSLNESVAASIYVDFQKKKISEFSLQHSGLLIHPHLGFFAYSPDGMFVENGVVALLEIKCPFKKKFYPSIPMYYYDL